MVDSKLFLVYEIDAETQSLSGASEVQFTPTPQGAYFADDEHRAVLKAGARLGRPGLFVAVETTLHQLEFSASVPSGTEVEKAAKIMQKSAGKKDLLSALAKAKKGEPAPAVDVTQPDGESKTDS
jgi:hypothetical protein